jgi:LPS O-antigen subunit length determinant protein (WzzB/FepE family)
MQRLEMAKVNEARDTSAFQILDHPALPTYKSRPRRSSVLLMGLLGGLLPGLVWTLGPTYLRALGGPAAKST